MVGNGDEREVRAWDRVEARLERLAEEVMAMGQVLRLVADRTLEFGHRFDHIDRRLDRIEGRLDRRLLVLEGAGR